MEIVLFLLGPNKGPAQRRESLKLGNSWITTVLLPLLLLSGCAKTTSQVVVALSDENRRQLNRVLLLTAWEPPANSGDFRSCFVSREGLYDFVDKELRPDEAIQKDLVAQFNSASPKIADLTTVPQASSMFRSGIEKGQNALPQIQKLIEGQGIQDALTVVVRPEIKCSIVLRPAGPVVPPSQGLHVVNTTAEASLIRLADGQTLYQGYDLGGVRRRKEIVFASLRQPESLRQELAKQYTDIAANISKQISGAE